MQSETAVTVCGVSAVLVVESEPILAGRICRWLEGMRIKVVRAHCAEEAIQMLRDVVFIGCSLDGLIVDYKLRAMSGCRILYDFRHEYPWAPVALITETEDISINCWAKARSVQILRKPVEFEDLRDWVVQVNPVCVQRA